MQQEWEIFELVNNAFSDQLYLRSVNEYYNIQETFDTEVAAINYVVKQGWKGAYYFVKKIYFE